MKFWAVGVRPLVYIIAYWQGLVKSRANGGVFPPIQCHYELLCSAVILW